MRDQLREMESTLQWRDNKIKALEAHRDYFMKKAQQPILLSRAQVHRVSPKVCRVNIDVDIEGAFHLCLYFQRKTQNFQDGGLIPGDEDQVETQQLLDEIEKLRGELIQEQQKKTVLNDEDLQIKEKLYQETKSRANKAEQEVESQKVRF